MRAWRNIKSAPCWGPSLSEDAWAGASLGAPSVSLKSFRGPPLKGPSERPWSGPSSFSCSSSAAAAATAGRATPPINNKHRKMGPWERPINYFGCMRRSHAVACMRFKPPFCFSVSLPAEGRSPKGPWGPWERIKSRRASRGSRSSKSTRPCRLRWANEDETGVSGDTLGAETRPAPTCCRGRGGPP